MPRGGRRVGAGRPKVELNYLEEVYIAGIFNVRLGEIFDTRWHERVETACQRLNPGAYEALLEAQRDLESFRQRGQLDSAAFKERAEDAEALREEWWGKRASPLHVPATRPRGILESVAAEVALHSSQWFGKPISKSKVKKIYKKYKSLIRGDKVK